MQNEKYIEEMIQYAEENNVPIMTNDGLRYLLNYIYKNKIRNILEVGTAIGYSAILMCSVDKEITVTTIERDEKRYLEALKNVKKMGLEERITLIYKDALETTVSDTYDLIFLDAAKAQNIKFFERFEKNLKKGGTVITDNMNFHGLVGSPQEKIASRNVRGLVRKIEDYKEYLRENNRYKTEFLDIGDGLAVSIAKNNK